MFELRRRQLEVTWILEGAYIPFLAESEGDLLVLLIDAVVANGRSHFVSGWFLIQLVSLPNSVCDRDVEIRKGVLASLRVRLFVSVRCRLSLVKMMLSNGCSVNA